ncbi:MAG: NusG domain II-containing protein [Gemmiger sp.]
MLQKESPSAPRRGGKANLIFLLVLAGAALALLGWQTWSRREREAGAAVLRYGDEPQTELRIPLDEDKTYDVDTGYYTVHIEVKDGAAAFVHSPCPDHTCESFGWLSQPGQWAACLPARAMLELEDAS